MQHLERNLANSQPIRGELLRLWRRASDPVQNWFQGRELALDTAADAPLVSPSSGGRP